MAKTMQEGECFISDSVTLKYNCD